MKQEGNRSSYYSTERKVEREMMPIHPAEEPAATRRNAVTRSVWYMLRNLDPGNPRSGTDDTPARVGRMWVDELCAGYEVNPHQLMERQFDPDGYQGMVIVRDIPLTSVCEHHLVPFTGYAHVGYIPGESVVGLSKIARVVDAYARRLQIQERLTEQVVSVIDESLDPLGVAVVIEAEHLCMTIRGVQKPGTTTTTSAVRGVFNTNAEGEKEEFLRLIGKA